MYFSKKAIDIQTSLDVNSCCSSISAAQTVCFLRMTSLTLSITSLKSLTLKTLPQKIGTTATSHDSVQEKEITTLEHCDSEHILVANRNCCCRSCCCCISTLDVDFCAVSTEIDTKTGAFKQRWAEDFFEYVVSPTILNKFLKWVFLSLCIGLTTWLATYAMNLSRPKSSYMQVFSSVQVQRNYSLECTKLLELFP